MKKLTTDQKKALVGTILFHVILVLLLMFLALRTPLPLPGEEGVEVNMGYNETGFGKVQKDHSKQKTVTKSVKKHKVVQKKKVIKEVKKDITPSKPQKQLDKNLTQNTDDAPSLKDKKKKKQKPKKEKKQPEKKIVKKETEVDSLKNNSEKEIKPEPKPKPVVNQRALFKGKSNKKNGSNQGITKGAGDQGKPHGYKESARYNGKGGEGNGISYSLGGRGSKYLEKPKVKVTETGTVVVQIWVDPDGNVVKASIKSKGTTVIDPALRKIALKAAKKSVFQRDPTAPAEQRGEITYKFISLK